MRRICLTVIMEPLVCLIGPPALLVVALVFVAHYRVRAVEPQPLAPIAQVRVAVGDKVETIAVVDWLRECWIVSSDGGVAHVGPHLDDACLAIRDAIAASAKQP